MSSFITPARQKRLNAIPDDALLKKIRAVTGYSQAQLADEMGMHRQSAVSRIETGARKLTGPSRKLAELIYHLKTDGKY